MSRTFSIRQLTKELGVTSRTLRHYEDEGLLAPERRGQARIYSQRDRARLTLILRGRRVGFTLAEIGEILDLYDADESGVVQLQHTMKKFSARIDALAKQRIDIDESIAELKLGLTMIQNRLAAETPPERVRVSGYGVMPAED
ncbi:MAG TPA: MerR family DNA-binding transcriptional regulator [Rhizomicrobium sp.]|jgi:DNA-binding transcriptional MerR regulator|nr:MerR family DNA-binding transcriptional regulator [Rhizomicrobium sp.]